MPAPTRWKTQVDELFDTRRGLGPVLSARALCRTVPSRGSGAAPAGPRWRFTAELTGMPGAGWPSGATGNSSHSGIIRKRVCLSQAGGRGHRRSSVRVSAGGGLGGFVLDVVPVFMLGLGLLSSAGLGWRSVSFCR